MATTDQCFGVHTSASVVEGAEAGEADGEQ